MHPQFHRARPVLDGRRDVNPKLDILEKRYGNHHGLTPPGRWHTGGRIEGPKRQPLLREHMSGRVELVTRGLCMVLTGPLNKW